MNIEDIKLPEAKAPETPEIKTEGQVSVAPTQATTQPQGQAVQEPNPTAPIDKKAEWDGDVNKLPPELQEWAKSVQRGFTKRSMAEAELRRRGQELDSFINSDDYKGYQSWKQGQATQQVVKQPEAPTPIITPQEWEEIQLDPTGLKLASKVDALVDKKIQQAAQTYGVELNNLKSQQNMTMFQTSLSDLADLHPEVLEWHQAGIMEPFVKEELQNPKHKSYDQVAAAAYERVAKITEYYENKANEKLQQRIKEKQNITTTSGIANGESNVTYVGDKKEAFEQALQNALQGKNIKVKVKK